ncbi:cyclic lactone autoinducer peptide [Anaerosolibacter sp.]|jgi:cyclic lactone autoinducer peptide|nr:cyclic lactone autoinducer peptide [Anaerosolibacter sp.]MDF2548107.1 hypothetical protein [Anaerosolibacter sp.]
MMRKLLQLSVAILTFFAFTSAASACTILGYQPELPEQLKDM